MLAPMSPMLHITMNVLRPRPQPEPELGPWPSGSLSMKSENLVRQTAFRNAWLWPDYVI